MLAQVWNFVVVSPNYLECSQKQCLISFWLSHEQQLAKKVGETVTDNKNCHQFMHHTFPYEMWLIKETVSSKNTDIGKYNECDILERHIQYESKQNAIVIFEDKLKGKQRI